MSYLTLVCIIVDHHKFRQREKLSKYDGHYIKETENDETKFALYFQFGNLHGLQSYWYDRGKRLVDW